MVTRLLNRLGGIRGAVRVGVLVAGGVAASTIAVGVAFVVPTGGGGGPGTANLWVDTNGGTCTRQPSAGGYVDAAACASLNAAYQAAANGDTVLISSGTYGGQALTSRAGAASPPVTFAPAPSASVTFTGTISTGDVGNNVAGANWWKVLGNHQITAVGLDIEIASNITLDGITFAHTFQANSDLGYISAGVNVTVSNSDLCCTGDNSKILLIDAFRGDSTNITLDGDVFHDQQQTNDANHFECLYANGVQGLTLTRSHFYGCKSTGDMLVTVSGAGTKQPINHVFENNIFEPGTDSSGSGTSAGAFSIQDPTVSMPVTGFVFKNNLWPGSTGPDLDNGTTSSGMTLINNAGTPPQCYGGDTYQRNTWTTRTCPGDNAANAGSLSAGFFANAAGHDFHYTASNPFIDAGASTGATVDKDGHARPVGGYDVGPYEFGS